VIDTVNHWRTLVGLQPLNVDPRIADAAQHHAEYLALTPQRSCWPNPHEEVMTCSAFSGKTMADRMQSAGYPSSIASEVINWETDATKVVDGWLWTVYHRQPLFDYRLISVGSAHAEGSMNGAATTHNVLDLGSPPNTSPQKQRGPIVFPIPGQTNVPPTFRGDLEGPTPPAPAGARSWQPGQESGTVVSMHFSTDRWSISEHHLYSTDNQTCNELAHTFASRANDPNLNRGTPSNDVFLYADAPLQPESDYVAWVSGTVNGEPFSRTWQFRTGQKSTQ
jgi:hypothetical protein